jgi:hypothetical protein
MATLDGINADHLLAYPYSRLPPMDRLWYAV